MFKKFLLWKARRNLAAAAQYEADLRESVQHMRHYVLPKLEREVEHLEMAVFLREKGVK